MIQVTQQQRDNALYARDVMWPAIKPEQVIDELGRWRCGSQACFGGHYAANPHFMEQGVSPSPMGGAPRLSNGVNSYFEATDKTFGCVELVEPRGDMRCDCSFEGTDHELVTHRLNWLIENSEVVA